MSSNWFARITAVSTEQLQLWRQKAYAARSRTCMVTIWLQLQLEVPKAAAGCGLATIYVMKIGLKL